MRISFALAALLSSALAFPATNLAGQESAAAYNWTAADGSTTTIYVGRGLEVITASELKKRTDTDTWSSFIENDACGGSSFQSVTTTGSPLVSDCAAIRDWAYSQGGGFAAPDVENVDCGGYCPVIWSNTCVFGIWNTGSQWLIGASDVGDLTRDSINMYQWNGYIGAQGTMLCQNFANTQWAIFHT